MNGRFVNFLSSYGLIILGFFGIFFASASIKTGHYPLLKFPEAQLMVQAKEGGDISAAPALPKSRPTIPLAKDDTEFDKNLTAITALVVDDQTNTILYEKKADEVRPLASMTKLMTALVLSDLPINWATSTIVQDCDCDNSSHQINTGEKFTMDELWNIALVGSSNSAIRAMVRVSGITEENFAILMNRKAADLKLTTAHFVEPTGLSAENKASARDAVTLLREALKKERIAETMKLSEYYAKPLNKEKKRLIWTTNWLLTNWVPNKFDKDEIVGKTGYIIDSGYNFVVRLNDDNNHFVRVVVMGAGSNEARFSEARDLAEWTFKHYLWPDEEGYDLLVE